MKERGNTKAGGAVVMILGSCLFWFVLVPHLIRISHRTTLSPGESQVVSYQKTFRTRQIGNMYYEAIWKGALSDIKTQVEAPDFINVEVLRMRVDTYNGAVTGGHYYLHPTIRFSALPNATTGDYKVKVHFTHPQFSVLKSDAEIIYDVRVRPRKVK